MGPVLLVVAVAAFAAQASPAPKPAPELARICVGETIDGAVAPADPRVTTPLLEKSHPGETLVGRSFWLDVEPTTPGDPIGWCTLDATSFDFDAYLVVRDESGAVLAEDESSRFSSQPQVVTDRLVGGRRFRVDVAALYGGAGAFRLVVTSGRPDPTRRLAQLNATIAEATAKLDARARRGEPDDLATARCHSVLACCFYEQSGFANATTHYARAIAIREERLGPDDTQVAFGLRLLGEMLRVQGRFDEAQTALDRALAIQRKNHGPDHPYVASVLRRIGWLFQGRGEFDRAHEAFEQALQIYEKTYGPDHLLVATALGEFGQLLVLQEQYDAARLRLERARKIVEQARGPDDAAVPWTLVALARLHVVKGQYAEAEALLERALKIDETARGPDSAFVASELVDLGRLRSAQDRVAEARSLFERATRIDEQLYGPESTAVAASLAALGRLLVAQDRYDEARPLYERATRIDEKVFGADSWIVASHLTDLGRLLYAQDRFAEARPLYERALKIDERVFGVDSASVACDLLDLGRLESAQDHLDEARTCFERALRIDEQRCGPDSATVSSALTNLARLLVAQDEYETARPLLERVLRVDERVRGPDHSSVAVDLRDLGDLLVMEDDYEGARPLYERALEIDEKVYGPDDATVSIDLSDLGDVLMAEDRCADARPLFDRALRIDEKVYGPESSAVASDLDDLGRLLVLFDEYEAARPLFERALAIDEHVFGPDESVVAPALVRLGRLFDDEGRYAEARPLLERALAIDERVYGPDSSTVSLDLSALGDLLTAQDDDAEAQLLYERALKIDERLHGPGSSEVALDLGDLGWQLFARGRYAEARPFYERALAIESAVFGPDSSRVATTLTNLGRLAVKVGRPLEARPLLEKAAALEERLYGPNDVAVARVDYWLAVVAQDVADVDGATKFSERSLAIDRAKLGPSDERTIGSLHLRGSVRADAGDWSAAYADWTEAATGLDGLIRANLWALTSAERIRFVQQGVDTVGWLASRPGALPPGFDETKLHDLVLHWKGIAARCTFASRERAARDLAPATRAKLDELRSVQARLSKRVYGGDETTADHGKTAEADGLDELRRRRDAVELEVARLLGPSAVESVSMASVRAALPPKSAAVDFLVHDVYTPTKKDGDRVVRRGTFGHPRLSAFVIAAGHDGSRWIDLGPVDAVDAAVKGFLSGLAAKDSAAALEPSRGAGAVVATDGGARAKGEDPATTLRRLLWDPIAAAVGDATLVVVSPDLSLGTLPFEVVPDVDGRLLIERRRFVYVQDLAQLPRLAATAARVEATVPSLLVAGGLDYDAQRETAAVTAAASSPASNLRGFSSRFGPLPATRVEALAIERMHESRFGADVPRLALVGDGATEERLKAELPNFAYVHLATHGYFEPDGMPSMRVAARRGDDRDDRLELGASTDRVALPGLMPGYLSGLVCSCANAAATKPTLDPRQPMAAQVAAAETRDDGFLSAEELSWLDLSKVDLVVLSACDTALGRPESGEGMIGLRSALRQAGVRTVISSLWSVDDESTAELMKRFYANLWQKRLGKLDALREAQLSMLRENVAKYSQPRAWTWGAFVLDGDWR